MTTTINIRTDEQTKRAAGLLCEELGLSLSTAVNIFLKTMVRERRIPFEITADPFYSSENMERIRHAVSSPEAGHGTAHEPIEERPAVKRTWDEETGDDYLY